MKAREKQKMGLTIFFSHLVPTYRTQKPEVLLESMTLDLSSQPCQKTAGPAHFNSTRHQVRIRRAGHRNKQIKEFSLTFVRRLDAASKNDRALKNEVQHYPLAALRHCK